MSGRVLDPENVLSRTRTKQTTKDSGFLACIMPLLRRAQSTTEMSVTPWSVAIAQSSPSDKGCKIKNHEEEW